MSHKLIRGWEERLDKLNNYLKLFAPYQNGLTGVGAEKEGGSNSKDEGLLENFEPCQSRLNHVESR